MDAKIIRTEWVAQAGPSIQVAFLALLVSLLSLVATLVRDARARQRESFDLRQAYSLQIEKWAAEVLDVMSEATFA